MKKTVLAFGEVLWDLLPTETALGGAVCNFIYRVNSLGDNGIIVSRLGRDELGEKAFQRVSDLGLGTEYLQCPVPIQKALFSSFYREGIPETIRAVKALQTRLSAGTKFSFVYGMVRIAFQLDDPGLAVLCQYPAPGRALPAGGSIPGGFARNDVLGRVQKRDQEPAGFLCAPCGRQRSGQTGQFEKISAFHRKVRKELAFQSEKIVIVKR